MNYQVHPKEEFYLKIMIVLGITLYAGLIFGVFSSFSAIFMLYSFYIGIFLLFSFLMRIYFAGYLRGNGVKVSSQQFPEMHKILVSQSERLGLDTVPTMYLLQGNGVLNAFAARFSGHNYVVLFSEVMAAAYQESQSAVEFIIGHELGHIKRNHVSAWKAFLMFPARFIPFLGSAYSRACEYTCDAIGHSLCPEGAQFGMLILAAGAKLFKKIDVNEMLQTIAHKDFAMSFAEIFSTHPHLVNRIENLEKLQKSALPQSAYVMDKNKEIVRQFDQQ